MKGKSKTPSKRKKRKKKEKKTKKNQDKKETNSQNKHAYQIVYPMKMKSREKLILAPRTPNE